jgi:hypothetical protein
LKFEAAADVHTADDDKNINARTQSRLVVSKSKLLYDHTKFNEVIELLISAIDKLSPEIEVTRKD